MKPAEAYTAQEMGWSGKVNGALMGVAIDAGFTTFITADKNLQHQNSLGKYDIAVIVLDIPRNKYEFIEPLKLRLLKALDLAKEERLQIIS
ncbi:MAG: hypothetical protein KF713_17930 [Turneriella sp.]|nr:hypothetical protein [Turneriella sp.]